MLTINRYNLGSDALPFWLGSITFIVGGQNAPRGFGSHYYSHFVILTLRRPPHHSKFGANLKLPNSSMRTCEANTLNNPIFSGLIPFLWSIFYIFELVFAVPRASQCLLNCYKRIMIVWPLHSTPRHWFRMHFSHKHDLTFENSLMRIQMRNNIPKMFKYTTKTLSQPK